MENSQKPTFFIRYDHFIIDELTREPLTEEIVVDHIRPTPPIVSLPGYLPLDLVVDRVTFLLFRLAYVTVEFDNYSGVPFDDHHPNIIPIPPLQMGRTFQLPLRLAWALTIHKSKGLTLSKATIDIGPRERARLTFVAISRVKSLEGLNAIIYI